MAKQIGLLSCLFCIVSSQLHAGNLLTPDAIRLSYGLGEGVDMHGGRLALQKDWPWQWFEPGAWFITGYFELSYAHLVDVDDDNGTDSPHIFAFTPVFQLKKHSPAFNFLTPFLEAAVGASLFTETRADGRKLSTSYQFEDRLGAGVLLGEKQQFELKYNYFHYSNASIKRPNQGVNVQWLSLAYHFD